MEFEEANDMRNGTRMREMTALMVCPDRALAGHFTRSIPETHAFQIVGDLSTYPTEQALDVRLKQLKPDLLIIDLATSLDQSIQLIGFLATQRPTVHVVGLHHSSHPEAILRSLRAGATEFLAAPFEISILREAVARLRKLLQPEPAAEQEAGRVIVFSSVKPGSGASTLAAQTAFALRRVTNQRVLLADFDLMGGALGFYLKLHSTYSLVDALESASHMDALMWSNLTVNCRGVDILQAPQMPCAAPVEQMQFHDLLEYVRLLYHWVVLDLPAVFHRVSLLALSESDTAYLVSTSELASLHLARKAIQTLSQLGIEKNRYQVVVNRVDRRDGINGSDLEKLFQCPVDSSYPNDYFSLHRAVTLGEPLGHDCELGKAIEALAGRLAGSMKAERSRPGGVLDTRPAFSET